MIYSISRKSIPSQFIQIHLSLECIENETVQLQLPSWRPGRYELTNYAQFLKGFGVRCEGRKILWKKISKDLWEFSSEKKSIYSVHYEFYCNRMDAGGCWSDEQQLYLNFTNFIFDVTNRQNEEIGIVVDLPDSYKVATSLSKNGHLNWKANDFQELMDSPLIASKNLEHLSYQINNSTFHIWLNGEIFFDRETLKSAFQSFTKTQIEAFGDFPATDYHFIIQLLPYKHYHGVEHAFSTVVTFGPAESLTEKKQMDELIGVCSHELYHFWNVCRIRPKPLLPYDLSKEVYLESGLIMEGITTYMGDLYLLKCGYFQLEEYLEILQKEIQKDFDSFGWKNQSIMESSFDLWLDGYKAGIPNKKVSIYTHGALISLCLDLMLIDENSSLQEVMNEMWQRFCENKIGYSFEEFESIVFGRFIQQSVIKDFFKKYIYGKDDLLGFLKKQLLSIGISVAETFEKDELLHLWGIRTDKNGTITQIHPDSKAYYQLMVGDKITEFNGEDFSKSPKSEQPD
uniref:M61 family metallopeptidase n=1 Tax=Aquiflexum sp. TaxID=1872584 RepID=UPI003593A4E0